MKILIVSPTTSTNGAGVIRHALALALQSAGHQVALAAPAEFTWTQRDEAAAGIAHLFYRIDPYRAFEAFLRDPRLAPETFDAARPDFVIFSSGLSPALQVPFMAEARARGVPYLIIEHLVSQNMFPAANANYLAPYYAAAREVVAVSDQNLAALRRGVALPPALGKVIRYGRPAEFFEARNAAARIALRAQWAIPRAALVVATVAKFEPVKGHDILIDAMRSLGAAPEWNRLGFVWIGDGPERASLVRRLHAAGLADHVRLLGHRWDVAQLYDGADLFALASHDEGMPLSVMEAMGKGLVPICTDVGGTAEAIGPAGIVVPAPQDRDRTVAALAAALTSLAADPARVQQLAQAARARAAALFREERMLAEYLALIDAVAPKK